MSCPDCLRALQRVVHRVYAKGCTGCEARMWAYASLEERERFYEKAQAHGGESCRREVKKLIDEERARIAVLKAAMPREKVT